MKLISFWLLVVISFSITSCKKEDNNNNILPDNTNRIARFALASVLPGGGVDTSFVRTFIWDASSRCTRIATNYVNSTADNYQIDNYYNGTDTIIAKRKFTYLSSPGISDWEYFTYDASGRMMSDSLTNQYGTLLISRYSVNAQGVITLNLNGPYTPILNATYRHNFDGAGNIINEIDSAFNYNISTGSFPFSHITVTTASYDNKPNPFYKVYPKRMVQLDHENPNFDMEPFWGMGQKNNITQEMRGPSQPASSGPQTYNHSATYQYNAAGYPSSVTFTDNETGEVLKGFYFY